MAKRSAKTSANCLLRKRNKLTELSRRHKRKRKDRLTAKKQRLHKAEEQITDTFPRVDSNGEFIVPKGPLFPLPTFGTALKALSSVTDFTLGKKFFKVSKKAEKKPPPFKLLTHNIYKGRSHCSVADDEIPVCNCEKWSRCRLEKCLNALCLTECFPKHCPCGDFCENQRFLKNQSKRLKVEKTDGRGWGLFCDQDIKAGEFIVEYCGEVISTKEFVRRADAYHAEGETNWYFLQLSGHEVIDAYKKGSLSRFINHSCKPNCETQKWTVMGEVCVGVFASVDIKAGSELTYNYNFECFGGEKVRCRCGADQCIQFLGARSQAFKADTSQQLSDDDEDGFEVCAAPMYDSDDGEAPLGKNGASPGSSSRKRKGKSESRGSPESKGQEPSRRRPNKWMQMRLDINKMKEAEDMSEAEAEEETEEPGEGSGSGEGEGDGEGEINGKEENEIEGALDSPDVQIGLRPGWVRTRKLRGARVRGGGRSALKRLFQKQSSGALITCKPLRENVLDKIAPDEETRMEIVEAQEEAIAKTEEVTALTTALRPVVEKLESGGFMDMKDSAQLIKALTAQRLAVVNSDSVRMLSGVRRLAVKREPRENMETELEE